MRSQYIPVIIVLVILHLIFGYNRDFVISEKNVTLFVLPSSGCALCTGNSINCWRELLVDHMYICLCVSQVN